MFKSVSWRLIVHRVEIARLKGSRFDAIIVYTNLLDPITGLEVSFSCMAPVGTGEQWTEELFPGVQTRLYDYRKGWNDAWPEVKADREQDSSQDSTPESRELIRA